MNRTDRLLAIVLELQARKQVRAEELAATFEVSKRTIYRDMEALSEAGVPIVAVTGQGYSLMEGYFLPPLSFTPDEAILLVLGTHVVAENFDAPYQKVAHSAGHKILTVLSEELRREVDYLERSIQFVTVKGPSAPETLRIVRQAIVERRTVRCRYHARTPTGESDSPTLREVDPYALIHIGNRWIVVGYCHLRRDRRHFRLDRMENVVVLEQRFTRPPDFKFELVENDDRTVMVRLLFDRDTMRLAQESRSLYQVAEEAHPDGLVVTYYVRQPADLLQWVLGWGAGVRVLEPEALKEMVVVAARGILGNYD